MALHHLHILLLVLPVLLVNVNGFDLPIKSRFKDQQENEKIKQLLENELSPIKEEFHKIEHALHLDESSASNKMRFKEVNTESKETPEYTGLPQASDVDKAMKALKETLKPGAMDAISTIINMFHKKDIQSQLSQEKTSVSPERMTSLISSAINNQPNLDKDRMNQMLENWKNQLSGPNFASMLHLNKPQQQLQMPLSPQPSFIQVPQYIPIAAAPQMMMPYPVQPMQPMMQPMFYPSAPIPPTAAPMKPLQFPPRSVEFSNANDFKNE